MRSMFGRSKAPDSNSHREYSAIVADGIAGSEFPNVYQIRPEREFWPENKKNSKTTPKMFRFEANSSIDTELRSVNTSVQSDRCWR